MEKEIENKLREIGYTGKTDLETILEALPKDIYNEETRQFEMLFMTKLGLFYGYEARLYWTKNKNDESLTDTAARLLILLNEKGIINFNK